MSKVDPTQDYYGALEISPDAGEDEIRKQYHRLAKKYHPDRNPGKEVEFQPRFQQIQAAHECLMDPEQRRKYDLSRKRGAGLGPHPAPRPGPSGQRGNPYKANSSFPPPPRPPGAPPRKNDAPQPPPRSSGADRYKEFSYPPPPRRPGDDTKSNQQARADVWTAWQKMNSAQNARNARSQPYHPTARNDADSPGSQRSAYDAVNNQQRPNSRPVPPRPRFGKTQTSGDGDSLPRTRDRPFGRSNPPRMNHDDMPPRSAPQVPPRPTVTTSRPDPTPNGHSHSASVDGYDKDAPYTENLRERTPYATQPGERTSFVGAAESIRRTRSVKDATKLHSSSGIDLDSRFSRHRSLSPTSRADSGSHNHSNAPQSGAPRSSRPPPSRQPSSQPWLQYSSSSTDSEGDRRPTRRRTYAAPGTSASTDHSGVHHSTPTSPALNKSKSDDGDSSSSAGPRLSSRPKARQRKPMFDVHSRGESSSRSGSPGKTYVEHDNHFPHAEASTPGFSPTASAAQTAGPSTGAQPGQQQMHPPPPPPQVQTAPEDGHSPGLGQTFRPEGWQKSFADSSWASQPGPSAGSKSSSPTRPASNTGRRVRPTAAQTNPRVRHSVADPTSDEVQERLEKGIFPPRPTIVGDEDAMDIDEPPASTSRRPSVVPDSGSDVSSSAAAHAAQHHISTDPPRSGWGLSPSATHSRRASTHGQDGDLPPASTQGPPQSAPARQSGQTLSMDSFRHVLPGQSNGTGIRNLDDLGATLPFESRAAAAHPFKAAEAIAGEQIPRPPLAPVPPLTFTQQTWDTYLASMGDYITKWNAYNARMISHFQDRCVAMSEFGHGDAAAAKVDGPSNAVVDGWLSAVGETNSKKGWASYVQQLRQDEAWRVSWTVACERHAEAIDKHGVVRERLVERGC